MKNIKNPYLIVSFLSILILALVLQLWEADLKVPFSYQVDAIFNLMTLKSIEDNGWYLHNEFIGSPFSLDAHDLPMAEGFTLIILKLIMFFLDSATTLNLFFIGTFPLTAITSLFVFKSLKISNSISIFLSLIYTFLPYHFLRGIDHLFLAAYYMVPLVTLIIISLWSNHSPLIYNNKCEQEKLKKYFFKQELIICIFICLILGSTGVYYAFFSCFLIVIGSISVFLYKKNNGVFLSAIFLILLISSSVFFNIIPSVIYSLKHGENPEVAHRPSSESEEFGLKIVHLLLPIQNHRFPVFNNVIKKYNESKPPLQNENTFASLGVIGSFGFLSLLFRSIFLSFNPRIKKSSPSITERLAILNISALLFATVGGFSSLFAVLISPQIRGVNRISVFIAFFSLLAVGLFLNRIQKQYVKNKSTKLIFSLALTILLLIGIFDQTSPAFIPKYSLLKREYLNDRNFVHKIERVIPKGSMIFQFPYIPFPEYMITFKRMNDYDLFRGYLHSKNLKWSYGAMKGRYFNWHQAISEEPLEVLLKKISLAGFRGIYIDRYGYSDSAKKIQTELEKQLGIKPIVSENGRLVFFNMNDFNESFLSLYTKEQIENYKWIILNPIQLEWKDGFHDQEQNLKEGKWNWSKKQSTLIINNPTSRVRKTTISMDLSTGWSDYSNLRIESNLFSETVKINKKSSIFSKTISLPPGKHLIRFSSDAQQVKTSNDPRKLFFRVLNLKFTEEQEKPFEDSSSDSTNDIEWKEGFYNPEKNIIEGIWRWSNKQSTLIINNPTSTAKAALIRMALSTGSSDYSSLRIESDIFSEVLKINKKPSVFSKTILLPPGKHLIKFSSDAQQFNAPNDSRKLFFRIFNLKVKLDQPQK